MVLTPEEWVRQHLLHYLVNERNYPISLLAIERGITVNHLKKRFDMLAFDNLGRPRLIIECKSPGTAIDNAVFMQAALYNSRFGAKNLLITNGLNHIYCEYADDFSYTIREEIPFYESLRI